MASSGPETPASLRPRATNTCRECRRRKVRCDRKRPACTRCAELRPALPCIYDAQDSRPRAFQFVSGGRLATSSATSSISAPDVATRRKPDETAEQILPDRLELIEKQLENLNQMVQALHDAQQPDLPSQEALGPVVRDNQSMMEGLSTQLDDIDIALPLGYLDVRSTGRTRFISRAFWASMCDEVSELQSLVRAQSRSAFSTAVEDSNDISFRENTVPEHISHFSPLGSQRLEANFSRDPKSLSLPSRAKSDALLEAYIYNVHPVAPLVHVPSFRREYQRFWECGPLVMNQLKVSSAPLILAALFAGAVASTDSVFRESLHDEDRDEMIRKLRGIASLALRQSGFPQSPTVESLSAYMLLQGTLMTEEEPLLNCGFVGVVVRVAQMLGLNCDPSQFETQLSPLAAEVRRRVWWHAHYLDVSIALASGLPSLVVDGSWEVRQLSECYDEYLGTEVGKEYDDDVRAGRQELSDCHSQGTLVCPLGVWLRGKMENAVMVRKLLDKSLNSRHMTLQDFSNTLDDLAHHKENMESRIARIPATALLNTYEHSVSFNNWAKLMLSAMGDQHWWFLYTRSAKDANSQRFRDAHEQIIDHSCKFLQKFMCLSACKLFERFNWAWPGNHQPLHIIMTLICEVEKVKDGTASSGLRRLVDQALALCGPQGGLTGSLGEGIMPRPLTAGGQEAWEVLMRRRTRAWIKLGADTHIPTRRESQANAEEMLETIMGTISGDPDLSMDNRTSFSDVFPFTLNWQDWNTTYDDAE